MALSAHNQMLEPEFTEDRFPIEDLPPNVIHSILAELDLDDLAQVACSGGRLGNYVLTHGLITEADRIPVTKLHYVPQSKRRKLRWTVRDVYGTEIVTTEDPDHLLGICYLRKPEKFVFSGGEEGLKLRKDWWNQIEKFTFQMKEPLLHLYIDRFQSCREINLLYPHPTNATDLFNAMPNLESLYFGGDKFSLDDHALSILAKNSHQTTGFRELSVMMRNRTGVTAKGLLEFIKNVKVAPGVQARISTLKGLDSLKKLQKTLSPINPVEVSNFGIHYKWRNPNRSIYIELITEVKDRRKRFFCLF